MMEKERKKSSRGIVLFLTALILLAGLLAFHMLIGRGMEKQIEKLPEGILLKLVEPLEAGEIMKAETAGYEVKNIEKGSGEVSIYTVRKTNEKPLHVNQVSDFTWNVFGRQIEGESLNLSSHRTMASEAVYLSWLMALLPMSVILLIVGIRKLGALQEKQWRQGVEGVLMIGAWLVVIYFLTGKLEIPREFLPPEQILDIRFYVDGIRGFFADDRWTDLELYQTLRACYNQEVEIYGAWVICGWIGTLIFWIAAGVESRNQKKRERRRQYG